MFVGGSPLVDLVILGTDWCWCTNSDKEVCLSFLLMELILSMPTYIILDLSLHANNIFSIYLCPSIVKFCIDHILFSFNYHICLSCPFMYVCPIVQMDEIFLYSKIVICFQALHSCNQQCPLVNPWALVLGLAWEEWIFIFAHVCE